MFAFQINNEQLLRQVCPKHWEWGGGHPIYFFAKQGIPATQPWPPRGTAVWSQDPATKLCKPVSHRWS